ncbi:MAG: hypothetical protein ABIH41_06040 [Nanoarchaeota archaeon]
MLDELASKYVSADKQQGDVEKLMHELQHDRVASVAELIKDIDDLIITRRNLSLEVMADLEKVKISINAFISSKTQFRTIELSPREMIELKKKEIEVDLAKVSEKVTCFKDIMILKQEMRMHVHDIQDKVKRFGVLENIIDL